MKFSLAKLETQIQTWIENSVGRLFPKASLAEFLLGKLLEALETNSYVDHEGMRNAPHHYVIHIPATLPIPDALAQELALALEKANEVTDIALTDTPVIQFAQESDETSPIWVEGIVHPKSIEQTVELPLSKDSPDLDEGAFLIVQSADIFPLTKITTTIGRQETNDVIIAAPDVSRLHAQIRQVNHEFHLFDLGSTAGTLVNGHPISRAVLRAGDVITIGKQTLIFGHDEDTHEDTTAPISL